MPELTPRLTPEILWQTRTNRVFASARAATRLRAGFAASIAPLKNASAGILQAVTPAREFSARLTHSFSLGIADIDPLLESRFLPTMDTDVPAVPSETTDETAQARRPFPTETRPRTARRDGDAFPPRSAAPPESLESPLSPDLRAMRREATPNAPPFEPNESIRAPFPPATNPVKGRQTDALPETARPLSRALEPASALIARRLNRTGESAAQTGASLRQKRSQKEAPPSQPRQNAETPTEIRPPDPRAASPRLWPTPLDTADAAQSAPANSDTPLSKQPTFPPVNPAANAAVIPPFFAAAFPGAETPTDAFPFRDDSEDVPESDAELAGRIADILREQAAQYGIEV